MSPARRSVRHAWHWNLVPGSHLCSGVRPDFILVLRLQGVKNSQMGKHLRGSLLLARRGRAWIDNGPRLAFPPCEESMSLKTAVPAFTGGNGENGLCRVGWASESHPTGEARRVARNAATSSPSVNSVTSCSNRQPFFVLTEGNEVNEDSVPHNHGPAHLCSSLLTPQAHDARSAIRQLIRR
jgi:hypothetical protein